MPYAEKRQHYVTQNLLARSLHGQGYERHPGFLACMRELTLPFQPLPQFGRTELEPRQQLYRALADRVWDPAQLQRELLEGV